MSFLSWLFGSDNQKEPPDSSDDDPAKLWSISDHRVKKTTLNGKNDYRGHRSTYTYTGYECIDCEKTKSHRGYFERIDCYEVIQE